MNITPVSGTSLADQVVTRMAQTVQAAEKDQAKKTDELVNHSASAPGMPEPGTPGAILSIYA